MNNNYHMEISIPTDNEGYILLICPYCGTFFKVAPSNIEDEGILEIFCPSCGLVGDNYITEDVINLVLAMAHNKANNVIYDELKKMERHLKKGPITLKVGRHPKHDPEDPIQSGIESMEFATFSCCRKNAKVKPLLKITGCYCPFCGVKNYEIE